MSDSWPLLVIVCYCWLFMGHPGLTYTSFTSCDISFFVSHFHLRLMSFFARDASRDVFRHGASDTYTLSTCKGLRTGRNWQFFIPRSGSIFSFSTSRGRGKPQPAPQRQVSILVHVLVEGAPVAAVSSPGEWGTSQAPEIATGKVFGGYPLDSSWEQCRHSWYRKIWEPDW